MLVVTSPSYNTAHSLWKMRKFGEATRSALCWLHGLLPVLRLTLAWPAEHMHSYTLTRVHTPRPGRARGPALLFPAPSALWASASHPPRVGRMEARPPPPRGAHAAPPRAPGIHFRNGLRCSRDAGSRCQVRAPAGGAGQPPQRAAVPSHPFLSAD